MPKPFSENPANPGQLDAQADGRPTVAPTAPQNPDRRLFLKTNFTALSGLLVASCGGGGGSGSTPSTPGVTPVSPTITDQPRDVSAVSGDTATFLVSAQGTLPLSYQWLRDGVGIPGADSPAYTTPTLSVGDDALFSVVVSSSAGTVTSRDAQLTVTAVAQAPFIVDHPRNTAVLVGGTATFQVAVQGTQPLSYQWRRDGVGIPGADSATYTTPVLAAGDDALFSVVVSNSVGSVISQSAQLTVLTTTVTVDSTSITVDATDLTADTL